MFQTITNALVTVAIGFVKKFFSRFKVEGFLNVTIQ